MKIALISPKGTFLSADPKFKDFLNDSEQFVNYRYYWSGFNSGLLIIAALTPNSFDIKFIDENFENIDFNKNYNLVAISAITQQATRAYQIADEFRKRGVKVVIGGIHATVLPEEAKQHADSVIVGEGEETWPRFIEDFLNNNLQPFYRSTNPVDLTKSPIPRYDIVKPGNYKMAWIQASRGCPRDCEFCAASNVYGFKYRHKTIDQVIKEVSYIKNIFKRSIQIGFADDNMFTNQRYSMALVKRLLPLNVRWFAQTDVSIADNESFLELLRQSGCTLLFIGFETLSGKTLKSLDRTNWKIKQIEKYPNIIKTIQSYGIGVMGAFIIGFDNDDTSVFKKLADFIINNHLYAAQVTILTPLPGTRLRRRLEEEKRILSYNWSDYSMCNITFSPKRMSAQELQDGFLEIYQQIYSKEVYFKKAEHFKEIYADLLTKDKK
ncbi:MAG: B12-binding domain-containing radical SAM protein [Candidatus Omnitrophota bacterium]|nr:MAG: B12-binding domain-containing radical SAM protein [Candidatus Omnitrophota bacterium]